MLKQRIITALILAPLAIAALFLLPLPAFAAVFLAVVAIGAWEWGPLMGFHNKPKRLFFAFSNIVIISLIWWQIPIESFWLTQHQVQPVATVLLWLAVAWWLLSALLTFLYPKFTKVWAAHRSIRGIFGWLTLVPTWLAFVLIRSSEYQLDTLFGAKLLVFLFLMVWGADIGAYFVGKAIGRRKLMPNVSPGKTIEGFVGGVFAAILIAVIVGISSGWNARELALGSLLALIIAIVSVLGDLSESMFKRQAGIKDSGSILPGHGGVLDRIDSLTATAPVFALCYITFGW